MVKAVTITLTDATEPLEVLCEDINTYPTNITIYEPNLMSDKHEMTLNELYIPLRRIKSVEVIEDEYEAFK